MTARRPSAARWGMAALSVLGAVVAVGVVPAVASAAPVPTTASSPATQHDRDVRPDPDLLRINVGADPGSSGASSACVAAARSTGAAVGDDCTQGIVVWNNTGSDYHRPVH
ncbi:hypothetical protein AB0K43_13205 [Kitasatospora sp. NPDC049258]|uniref:hypothetical protein n=1 Tax=Kitasatospora sp. NPDC049258 TaxID=3155394 RepID=UPI00343AF390